MQRFDSYILSYSTTILHHDRLEVKYFHFAQFFSMLIKQLLDLDKVRTDNEIFEIELWMVSQ